MENEKKIVEIIKKYNDDFIKNELIPFLRIPSNTINKKGILEAKNFLLSYISNFAKDIKEFEGKINPLIVANVSGKLKESLLIYLMYDTQPISKEKEWFSEPFEAEIMELPFPLDDLGECIIARGAYNSKTSLLSFLSVVKALKEMNKLPISLLLILDAEEEIGSPTLLNILKNNKEEFKNCIDVYYPSNKQDLSGKPILKLGYKGILSITINVYTQNKEPHSAFSAMIPNPVSNLISLLNTIYNKNKFQIDCLKKTYQPTIEEEALIDSLMEELDIEKIKIKAGIVQTLEENSKESFLGYIFNPTFNISSLKSGYLKEGIKNMVPNRASCNIDIRFAHDISINKLYEEIVEKVDNFSKDSKCFFEIKKNNGYEGSRVRRDTTLINSLISSFNKLEKSPEIWPLSPAAAPLSSIQKELKLNYVVGGLGIGGFAHSPNEFIQLNSIINTRLGNYYFLNIYSNLLNKENKNV